jgi:hypothetical protein
MNNLLTNAGMIEEALGNFFRSDAQFKVVEESAAHSKTVQPSLSWYVSGGIFERDQKGTRMEKLSAVCLATTKNVASEKERRQEAHEVASIIIARLSDISLELKSGAVAGTFEPLSWQDISEEPIFSDTKTMAVRIEFSVSMPAQSEHEPIEESGESLKESIRVAFKRLLESPSYNYRTLPTLANWKFENKTETLAKVFWSNKSEVADERMNSFLRRKDTLNIIVATPNTIDNWQDKTSLIEEKFNYAKINQKEIMELMPESRAQSLGLVKISDVDVEYPALPEAYAITKISIIVDYALSQRG